MKFYGPLEDASLEQLSTDPAANTQGRIFVNTTEARIKTDDGVSKRALLRNDQKLIIGNDAAPANNVRIHKATSGLIQDVLGDDATVEGTAATVFAQRTFRDENKTSVTLPAVGNVGRHAYLTDQKVLAEDDGVNWRKHIPEFSANDAASGGTISIGAITSSVVRLTGAFTTLTMIPAGFASQRTTLINRTGFDVAIAHDSGATPANRIYTGTNANLVFKSNSSLALYYDLTTSRWQVVGEAAGASAGGGSMPNSAVASIAADYTVLITDDVILADTSLGPIVATLPNPVGNTGKRYLIEKVGNRQNNLLTIVGTVNGFTNEYVWALDAPVEIVSNGTEWKTVSEISGTLLFEGVNTANTVLVAATSTANVSLETLSQASLTNIDNVLAKSGQRLLLKNQTAAEENGLYLMPAVNITISATANADVDISLLSNGDTVPTAGGPVFVSTGQLVSLRFQTDPTQNGIYVVGATDGLTVRDTSQRDPSYVTSLSLEDALVYSDFYNYPAASIALVATESIASHANDLKLWKQTNESPVTFSAQNWSITSTTYLITVPTNAKSIDYEICPFGGAGAGGTNARGGSSASGAVPFRLSRKVASGSAVQITVSNGALPGTGKTGSAGGSASIALAHSSPVLALTVAGASGAPATGAAGITAVSLAGGPLFTNGATNNAVGIASYFAPVGVKGTGGASGGGSGGSGLAPGGNGGNGSAAANFLGLPGLAPSGVNYGGGGGGGGQGPASGRPGRGGFAGAGYVKLVWG